MCPGISLVYDSHSEMIAWSDVSEIRIVAVFKHMMRVNLCSVS